MRRCTDRFLLVSCSFCVSCDLSKTDEEIRVFMVIIKAVRRLKKHVINYMLCDYLI